MASSLRPANLLTIVGATALCGVVSLVYPFGRDQGSYAYAGWVLLEGGAPYRDVFVFKPPMTPWVHAIALWLFGVNTWAIRVLDIGWNALTALTIAAIALELWRRRDVAVVAGMAWPFLYYQVDYWNTAQTDGWMVLPGALAIWCVLRGAHALEQTSRVAYAWWIAAGAAAGTAFLFKYTAAAVGLPMLAALAFTASSRGRSVWRGLVPIGLGLALSIGGCFAWLATTGAWDEFVEIQRSFVAPYVGQRRGSATLYESLIEVVRLSRMQNDLVPLLVTAPISIVPAVLATRRLGRGAWWALSVPVAWWFAALASVVAQGKYFDYHYLPIIAPSALLAGLAFGLLSEWCAGWLSAGPARTVAAVTLGVLLVAATPIGRRAWDLSRILAGAQTVEAYLSSRREYSLPSYRVEEIRRVADFVAQTTTPDQRVFVWGFHSTINVRAQRHTVSRFLYNTPFRAARQRDRYARELIEALEARPPDIIVVASGDRHFGLDGDVVDSRGLIGEIEELRAFILERYEPMQPIGRFGIYRLAL